MKLRLRRCLVPDAFVRRPSCAWQGGAGRAAPSPSGWSVGSPVSWSSLCVVGSCVGCCGVSCCVEGAESESTTATSCGCCSGVRWGAVWSALDSLAIHFPPGGPMGCQWDGRGQVRGVQDALRGHLGAPHLRGTLEDLLGRGLGPVIGSHLAGGLEGFGLAFTSGVELAAEVFSAWGRGWRWAGVPSNGCCLCWEMRLL